MYGPDPYLGPTCVLERISDFPGSAPVFCIAIRAQNFGPARVTFKQGNLQNLNLTTVCKILCV